jgi:hypothetical protein
MNSSFRASILAAVTLLLSAGNSASGSARTQTATSLSDQPSPLVFVQGRGERADGSSAGITGLYRALQPNTPVSLQLHADPGTCLPWSPDGPRPAPEGAVAWATWNIELSLVALAGDRATVDVRSTRALVVPNGGETETVEGFRTEVTAGRPTALDILRMPDDGQSRCRRVVIELGLKPVEEESHAVLRYDLWLVQREPGGREIVQRQQTNGRQSDKVAFVFAPAWYRRDGVLLAAPAADALETSISGTVTGRAKRDGSVDLQIETERALVSGGKGGLSSGGFKQLTVRPGETIEVVLPPLSDRLIERDGPGAPGAAELGRTFARHSTSIRMTTTRLR